jgi:hypothetical protein
VARRKNPAAVALAARRMQAMTAEERKAVARMGGRARARKISKAERMAIGAKAGRARAGALTPEERKAIAQKAAAARWGKAPRKPEAKA